MQPSRRGRYNFDPSKETVLGILGSNELVIERKLSHLHLDESTLAEALLLIDGQDRDHIVEEVDCGRVIGFQRCVETNSDDEIVFAHRKDREGPTRFVLNREATPTTRVTVVLVRDALKPGLIVLISAWAGNKSQPEPWDKGLSENALGRQASLDFWQDHALVWDPYEVDFSRPFGTQEEMIEWLQ